MARNSEPNITEEERIDAERGAALIAAAMSQTFAPQSLREAIERDRARAGAQPARRRRFGRLLGPAGAAALAACVAAVIAAVSIFPTGDGGTAGPSIAQVASISGLPALSPAPHSAGANLDVAVEGLIFPDWGWLNWHASGRRADTVNGRHVTTVFYSGPTGVKLGYSIVAGKPIGGWPAGRDVRRGDDTYRIAHGAGRTTIVWLQKNHTCVVDAPSSVPDDKLITLAAAESV